MQGIEGTFTIERYVEALRGLEGAVIERVHYADWEPHEWDDETLSRTCPVSLTIKTKDGGVLFVTPMTEANGGIPAWLNFELPF